MTVWIRELLDDDLPALLDLYSQLSEGRQPQLAVEQARSLLSRIRAYPNYRIYVATINDEVVGTFALLIMDNIGNGGRPSGVVEDVVVSQKFRAQGISKAMMAHALDLCQRADCYKLTLSSNLQREAAHRFNESLEFRKHGYSFSIDVAEQKITAEAPASREKLGH